MAGAELEEDRYRRLKEDLQKIDFDIRELQNKQLLVENALIKLDLTIDMKVLNGITTRIEKTEEITGVYDKRMKFIEKIVWVLSGGIITLTITRPDLWALIKHLFQ